MTIRLITLLVCCALGTTGCVSNAGAQHPFTPIAFANHTVPVMDQADTCNAALDEPKHVVGELDPGSIDLLVWNVQKGRHDGWLDDLSQLSSEKDLVLIQEALRPPAIASALEASTFWSFAPGYLTASGPSGVVTFSGIQPLVQCNLSNREPLLRSLKATSVVEYALKGVRDTLLVVNIHGVNFTFGVRAFADQMAQVGEVISTHDGPVIFSGDFNTWRQKRVALVNELIDRLGLEALSFEEDHRSTVFGNPLDHVYVRGLTALETMTRPVKTSDHNPMSVKLML